LAQLLHKYGKTAAISAASLVGDSKLFLIDYLLRLLRVGLLLSIWRTLFAGRAAVGGMTLPVVLTYSLVAEAFGEPLNARTDLPDYFWNGTITTRFLRPMSLFGQFGAEACGKWAMGFCLFSLPLLLLAPLMGVTPLPASAASGLYFAISLVLAVSVGMALEASFVAVGIWSQMPVWAIDRARSALNALLSGALIPLALLPFHLGAAFEWLPFASMASAPMRLYTGTGDPLQMIGLQLAWCAALWPLAYRLWDASRERMVSYGG
jgi:ABC-2 type transport system permease protein